MAGYSISGLSLDSQSRSDMLPATRVLVLEPLAHIFLTGGCQRSALKLVSLLIGPNTDFTERRRKNMVNKILAIMACALLSKGQSVSAYAQSPSISAAFFVDRSATMATDRLVITLTGTY